MRPLLEASEDRVRPGDRPSPQAHARLEAGFIDFLLNPGRIQQVESPKSEEHNIVQYSIV